MKLLLVTVVDVPWVGPVGRQLRRGHSHIQCFLSSIFVVQDLLPSVHFGKRPEMTLTYLSEAQLSADLPILRLKPY